MSGTCVALYPDGPADGHGAAGIGIRGHAGTDALSFQAWCPCCVCAAYTVGAVLDSGGQASGITKGMTFYYQMTTEQCKIILPSLRNRNLFSRYPLHLTFYL